MSGALWFVVYHTEKLKTAAISKTISHVFKRKSICFSSPFARFISGGLVLKTTPGLCSIPFRYFDGRVLWRSNSIPFFVIKPFKEEKEMKIRSTYIPATFALKRMLTRYNFGAARDPEMLHKIYKAEPVAPIIEIPRRAFNDGRETDPFLPVRQHDAAIQGRQLQS